MWKNTYAEAPRGAGGFGQYEVGTGPLRLGLRP